MEANEFVRYRANVASLAKGGFSIDTTVEVQRATAPPQMVITSEKGKDNVIVPLVIEVTPNSIEADVLTRLRSFVDKLRAEYPAQVVEK